MFIPHSAADRETMHKTIGVPSADALFDCIPEGIRLRTPLDLPPALSEMELTRHLEELAAKNKSGDRLASFLGGGCYDHFVPAVVDAISSRPEYYTAYTPYQAEASQGTLQIGFEFQTLMAQLTGMDVSNASMYEAATAAVEAALACRAAAPAGAKIVVSAAVHPEYRQTLATYLVNLNSELVVIPAPEGVTDVKALKAALKDQAACLIMQHPNFFGNLEPMAEAVAAAKEKDVPVIQAFDPISVGLLKRPADYGVDIAVGEGQSLGTPPSFGGPFLGIFACKDKFLRRLPGRVVGETVDRHGTRCFVLTLQTREQHIRREKATSNICTNQGLLALRASVYLSLVGPQGLKEVATLSHRKARYAAAKLSEVPGLRLKYAAPFFKEFVLETPGPAEQYLPDLVSSGFHAGVPLGKWYPQLSNCLLVAVTEKRTEEEIDALANVWNAILS
ncbi:MAG TPA: aminomethyl-transferring glycine dehydrogenase subunit GcvPA [Planctomycetia bacterium]|nr:aminomethyl-transferring glycine dehydrogenase subunit GcvPA [Planctomycetia bacterium]